MVTIKDIAKRADVSTASVSYVLNGQEHKVGAETCKKIKQIIKELNYRPNLIARGLKKTKTNMIGVMIVDFLNPFFSEVLHGIHDACLENNYQFILCYSEDNMASEIEHLYALVDRQVDGIIATPVVWCEKKNTKVVRDYLKCLELIRQQNIPLISIVNKFQYTECDTILHDMYGGAIAAMEHLIGNGHKRIAFLDAPPLPDDPGLRYRGYRDCLANHGIALDEKLVITSAIGIEPAYQAVHNFLLGKPDFTAFFIFNDFMAIGAVRALREAGYNIPADISVVGFDNIKESSYLDIPLTTVNLPKYDLGHLAVYYLNKKINQDLAVSEQVNIILESNLVVRNSSGPVKPAN